MDELGNHRFVILKIMRKLLSFPRVATAGHSGQSAIITDTNLGDSGKADFLARSQADNSSKWRLAPWDTRSSSKYYVVLHCPGEHVYL